MSATMDDIEITSLPRNSEAPVADRPEDDVSGAVAVEWQPSGHEKAVIYTLAVINLLVSLDATIIVTALGVRQDPQTPTCVEDTQLNNYY